MKGTSTTKGIEGIDGALVIPWRIAVTRKAYAHPGSTQMDIVLSRERSNTILRERSAGVAAGQGLCL